jgi:peptide chain release factor 2
MTGQESVNVAKEFNDRLEISGVIVELGEEAKQKSKLEGISGNIDDNAFGSQIRSYVLHPYSMVKDHRTTVESSNPSNVLDGDLDEFLTSYLQWIKNSKN